MKRPRTVTANKPEPGGAPVSNRLALGDGWRADLARRDGSAVLRISHGARQGTLELEIALTDAGPVVRAHAVAMEIESDGDLVARCDRFRVEARQAVELVSAGVLKAEGREVDVRATLGSARVRANDDVQLLGEQILLNCDRPAPVPRWIPAALPDEQTIPRQDEGGDPDVLRAAESD